VGALVGIILGSIVGAIILLYVVVRLWRRGSEVWML
jgi:hypothetical protein